MKQQVWSSPKTAFEEFVPQVYCANCSGDDYTKTTYNFECNAGTSSFFGSTIYLETNGVDGLQSSGSNKDKELGSYNPCGVKHTVEVTGKLTESNLNEIFPKGYLVKNSRITNVRVWTANNTNIHCTTALDISEFQLAKS